ncbi:MAG: anaerobic ribonucleoside-triphosphate reductase [Gordonibacter sp.]|uniref:anaerobic ribonucleoside-triphosphate reductase n=1 Tax=Gordonibacter sp. TaxID=1968902 RepID=UPI002FC84540
MAHASNLKVSGIDVSISYASESDQPVTEHEVEAYISRAHDQRPAQKLTALKLQVEGEDVGISYSFEPMPFDRIRRITGYLVGTMDRWNNAKTSEEADRVKHGIAREEREPACA